MKAVALRGNGEAAVIDAPVAEVEDDLVLVKIMASAICGTEHGAYHGANPVSAPGGSGHEAAGIVCEVGPRARVGVGDRISVYPTLHELCMHCPACRRQEWLHCESPQPRRHHMGTHAQYMLVPDYLCLPIPDEIPFAVAAMVDDCIGTPWRAIKRMGIGAGDTVLVTGAGPIGAAATMIARFLNAKVAIVDVNDYRLDRARAMGADWSFNPDRDDVRKAMPVRVDAAIDCSGQAEAQALCLDVTAYLGKVALLGIKNQSVQLEMTRHLVVKELTVFGSWASTPIEHAEIVAAIQAGMPADALITHRYGIDEGPEALAKFFGGQAVKVIIEPWQGPGDQV